MDKKTQSTLKKQLKEITEYLKRDDLTIEEREEFELLSAKIAGALTHDWLPSDLGRRLIMVILFLIGLYGLMDGDNYFLISWIFLPMFSPRLMGELAHLAGKASRIADFMKD